MTGPRGPTEPLDAAALDAASQEYLRVFATHREALVAAIRVYLAVARPALTVETLTALLSDREFIQCEGASFEAQAEWLLSRLRPS